MGSINVTRFDHLVLTVRDIEATAEFYVRVLGFRRVYSRGRVALHFGDQKINLHEAGSEFPPCAAIPTAGSEDFCLITSSAADEIARHFEEAGVELELGPIQRNGALGAMTSFYFRDPDENLVEVATYPG